MSGVINENDIYNSSNIPEMDVKHDSSLEGDGTDDNPLKAVNVVYLNLTKKINNTFQFDSSYSEITQILNSGRLPIVKFIIESSNDIFYLYYHGWDDGSNDKKYKFSSSDNYHYGDDYGFITSFHLLENDTIQVKDLRVIEKVKHDSSLEGDGDLVNPLKTNIQHDDTLNGLGNNEDKLKLKSFLSPSVENVIGLSSIAFNVGSTIKLMDFLIGSSVTIPSIDYSKYFDIYLLCIESININVIDNELKFVFNLTDDSNNIIWQSEEIVRMSTGNQIYKVCKKIEHQKFIDNTSKFNLNVKNVGAYNSTITISHSIAGYPPRVMISFDG